MKYEEYQKMYKEALRLDEDFSTVSLPIEMLPGESPADTFLRFLLEEELVETDGNVWRIIDRNKVAEFDPNLLKILDAMIMSNVRAEMDALQEMGFVYMTADDDGNIVYELTDEGKEYLNE